MAEKSGFREIEGKIAMFYRVKDVQGNDGGSSYPEV